MPTLYPTLLSLLLQPGVEGPAPMPVLDDERPVHSDRHASMREQTAAGWSAERRRLQIRTGLSGAFAGVMLLTGTLLMTVPDGCTNINCELNYGRFFTGLALIPLAAIPISTGIVYGVRLHRHNRQRPAAILAPRAGGFALHF